jgi:hypothetical protein
LTATILSIGIKCNYCSRERHPAEVMQIGEGGAQICMRCLVAHEQALNAFANGTPPKECQVCQTPFELMQCDREGNIPMTLQMLPKDGIWQVLCQRCAGEYEAQRSDLIRGTAYGKSKGIY